MQAYMVLIWECYILQPTENQLRVTLVEAWAKESSKPDPMVMHFLQQGHTQNTATSFGGHFFQITMFYSQDPKFL